MVSRGNRISILSKTLPCFLEQTYPKIVEWLIVNGSQTQEEADQFKAFVETLQAKHPLIRTLPWIGKKNIGAYRNQVNANVVGDIVVSFDDDDYYFKDRVAVTVKHMEKNKHQVAGCENFYIYDMDMNRVFLVNLNLNISVCNNTIAYTREFGQKNKYDETKTHAEEPSFYGNAKILQLPKESMTIQMSHVSNTYNKRTILLEGISKAENITPNGSTVMIQKTIYDLTPAEDHDLIREITSDHAKCVENPADIVFYCGTFNDEWDPASKSLGGSEQAAVAVAAGLVKRGYSVELYGNIPKDVMHQGVSYKKYASFQFRNKYKTLVLWRTNGCMALGLDLKADRIICDLHDNFPLCYGILNKYNHKINTYWFKSNFHKREFESQCKIQLRPDQYFIQPNGIRVEDFSKDYGVQRDPYRFIYASSYDRGLVWILKGLWPIIRQMEPRAELHVYYGMSKQMNPEMRAMIMDALQTEGVMNHGRQPVEVIARAKQQATFHMYPCFVNAEIDCITIRESLVAGCIPLLSKYGVFTERDGIHLDLDLRNPQSFLRPALMIAQMMRDPVKLEQERVRLRKSSTITTWEDSVSALCKHIPSPLPPPQKPVEITLNV